MKSLGTFHNCQSQRGFTLIELILVVALISTLGLFVSPIGISFYRAQQLNETSDGLVNALRQAQNFSMSGKHEQAFGVYLNDEGYTIFEGDSYELRNQSEDQIFSVSESVSIDGLVEVTFSKITGIPSQSGTVVIYSGSKETQIDILSSGNIQR